ncbi:MAG TPA: VOC family protein [Acidimicrobiia bacterium]|nr:VOC family protein [Acidimicrobiia bacterium]
MAIHWFSLTVDTHDPAMLSRWWAEVLDYNVVFEEESYTAIAKDGQTFPGIVFNKVDEIKAGKNRLHWDLNPTDQAAEVERLLSLGAVRTDIGQGEVPWVVMADPEGNEFCVLVPWTNDAS